jgi:DNA replication and repair protein RecF
MFLAQIQLHNFKNYEYDAFEFSEAINCIVGENGCGKTNLLDAIYFLSLTKSAFSNQDVFSIFHEADFMMIQGIFFKNSKNESITCSLQKGQRKAVLYDKKPYEKLAEHIGKYPVVLIAPNDADIIRDGSEERRRFFDGVLAQLDSQYLENLLHYNRLLAQRNSLLKQFAEQNYVDDLLLDIYSEPVAEYSIKLYDTRSSFLAKFLPIFQKHYTNLSESRENVTIIYESEMSLSDFTSEFRRTRPRDLAAQRTTRGAHKDDFIFEINNFPLRKYGSQGQQKAFLIALKLAQFELLASEKGIKPMLLLDDIFDKLDDRRIQKLLEMVQEEVFGQIFITDARPERTRALLNGLKVEAKYFEVRRR